MTEHVRDFDLIEAEENLLIDFQFLIHDLMVKNGVTRKVLADRAGISVARLSQLFRPEANPTTKTFARLLHAMGEKVELYVCPRADEREIRFGIAEWEFSHEVEPAQRLSRNKREDILELARGFGASNDNYTGNVIEAYEGDLLDAAA